MSSVAPPACVCALLKATSDRESEGNWHKSLSARLPRQLVLTKGSARAAGGDVTSGWGDSTEGNLSCYFECGSGGGKQMVAFFGFANEPKFNLSCERLFRTSVLG